MLESCNAVQALWKPECVKPTVCYKTAYRSSQKCAKLQHFYGLNSKRFTSYSQFVEYFFTLLYYLPGGIGSCCGGWPTIFSFSTLMLLVLVETLNPHVDYPTLLLRRTQSMIILS